MEKRTDGKLRILYVREILLSRDAPDRAITMAELLSLLGAYGVSADRKSIYDDFRQLRRFGIQVACTSRGRYSRYYAQQSQTAAKMRIVSGGS